MYKSGGRLLCAGYTTWYKSGGTLMASCCVQVTLHGTSQVVG